METENIDHIEELVTRLRLGRITRSEMDELRAWTQSAPENRDIVRSQLQLDVAAEAMDKDESFDDGAAYQRFLDHVRRAEARNGMKMWKYIAAAAAVILLIALPWVGFHYGADYVRQDFEPISVTVPDGSRLSMRLPDGTQVQLNSGSSILYSQGFGITNRTLKLEGEALFNVKHDANLPFVIETREMSVKDVGTEFSMRNYADEEYATVKLLSGLVDVENHMLPSGLCRLQPHEQLVLTKQTGRIVKSRMDDAVTSRNAITDITFDGASIAVIARQLSRLYGVHVDFDKGIAGYTFYGSFNRDTDSLEHILAMIAATGKVGYSKNGKGYRLYALDK